MQLSDETTGKHQPTISGHCIRWSTRPTGSRFMQTYQVFCIAIFWLNKSTPISYLSTGLIFYWLFHGRISLILTVLEQSTQNKRVHSFSFLEWCCSQSACSGRAVVNVVFFITDGHSLLHVPQHIPLLFEDLLICTFISRRGLTVAYFFLVTF